MTNRLDVLRCAIARSKHRTIAEPPEPLQQLLQAGPPLTNDSTLQQLIWEFVQQHLPFIRTLDLKQPSAQELDQLTDLIAWLIAEFKAVWSAEPGDALYRPSILLNLTHHLDWDGTFWSQLPEDVGMNPELMSVLSAFVSGARVHLQPAISPTPLSNEETIERFNRADSRADWGVLSDLWHRMELGWSYPALSQAVRCLRRFDYPRLISATERIGQSAVAATIAEALPIDDALHLATQSGSLHQKFACLQLRLSEGEELGVVGQQALTDLLTQAAHDSDLWRVWMEVFNRYPTRYPTLQASLGVALSKVPERAIEDYLQALVMTIYDPNREIVSVCLRAFHRSADLSRRQALWTAAYERWVAWDFDRLVVSSDLSKITRSALDYAIVGYALECMPSEKRDGHIEALTRAIWSVDREWYPSVIECMSARYRLQSRLQPFAHAQQVGSTASLDWLTVNHYIHNFRDWEEYNAIKYGLR